MANEKENVLHANAGAPAADIPDLKKKDKERKRAGAAWSGGRGAAGSFSGATGGVARAAASAAAEGALAGAEGVEGGGLWAAVSRFLAGLTSTLLGKMAVGAAAFLMVAAAGILGYRMTQGKGDGGVGAPNLGAISDSMRVREGGDDRLGVESKGEIRFDPLAAVKQLVAPPPVEVKPTEVKPAPDATADADVLKPVPAGLLAHNLSGAQLTSSLGGDFGSKNIFAGNSAVAKFNAGAANLSKIAASKGRLSTMKPSTLRATPSAFMLNRGSAGKAIGQLRLAKGLSEQGANANTTEGAATSAQSAFEQQQVAAGTGGLATTGAPGGDTPPALGGGAPDTSMPTAAATPTSTAMDPGLQSAISQISQMADQAESDVKKGEEELIAGAVLIAAGAAVISAGGVWAIAIGIVMILAGVALLIMGVMNISNGNKEAQQAISMGQQLASSIGNMQQGNAITYCTGNAVATGTSVEGCTPPDSVTNATNESTQDASDIQRVQQIPVDNMKIITQ